MGFAPCSSATKSVRFSIDLEGKNSHAHNVYVNPKTGEIGRKTHSKDNYLELSKKEWNLVNKFSQWKKK